MKPASNPTQAKLAQAIDLQNKGEPKKATTLFLQVLKSQPDNIFALYSLAAIESNAGNHSAALNFASRAVTVNPNFAQALLARSVILYKLGRLDEAVQDVDKALILDPSFEAAKAHKEAINTAKTSGLPTAPPVAGPSAELNAKALQLQDQGKIEEALAVLDEMDPDQLVAISIADIELMEKKYDEAIETTEDIENEDDATGGEEAHK